MESDLNLAFVRARLPLAALALFVFAAPTRAQTAAPVSPAPPRAYDFYGRGPYRRNIPRPAAVLGYEAGATHSTFRDQERVILAIAAAAKDRVRVIEYGKSVEGRPLRLVLVSAPENIARLETIRQEIGKLADPRLLASQAEGERLCQTTPVITWINHCIHGDESASFETVLQTLYTLAASEAPAITETLQKSVVILNPVFNPDGHERFAVYYNSVAVGSPEPFAYDQRQPWAISGRFNHYRFDMNRDKLMLSQPESQMETAAFLQWHPQVFADQHGQPENYFFPPNSLPSNRNVDRARINKWTDIFGRANGAAFDRYGWQYVTRETFDFFYPGYLDTWTSLSGAIGMTYETDGGGNLARRRNDDTISTLRDAISHHYETALSTIVTAAKRHDELLRDYLAYRRGALAPPPANSANAPNSATTASATSEKMRRVVILPGADPGRLKELATLLLREGVEVRELKTAFSSNRAWNYMAAGDKMRAAQTQTFAPGALVVDMAQPQGHVARAVLEPDPDFEPEFVREQYARRVRNEKRNENEPKEGYDFYDTTAWALPYAFGLDAYWTEDAPPVEGRLLRLDAQGRADATGAVGGIAGGRASVAYVFRYDSDGAAFLALRLLQEDYKLAVATKPVRLGGRDWPRGALIARVVRNPETLHARLAQLAGETGVSVTAINSGYSDESPVGLGSENVVSLRKPGVAVIADDSVSQTGFGAIWHLFEREVGLKFTPLRLASLRANTLARFNVIVLPEGYGYAGALGKTGLDALKQWIGAGGVLIGLGSGGQWFTDKDAALTSAIPVGSDVKDDEKDAKKDDGKPEARKPDGSPAVPPKPKKPLRLPGAIFRAQIDPTHFLGFGYEKGEIAVPLEGATFLKPSKMGANPVTFGPGPSRLSGFAWPDNTEALLANTAYVVDEPIGEGHALLYLNDPTFRASWPGLRRLFLSGILFGPTSAILAPARRAEE